MYAGREPRVHPLLRARNGTGEYIAIAIAIDMIDIDEWICIYTFIYAGHEPRRHPLLRTCHGSGEYICTYL